MSLILFLLEQRAGHLLAMLICSITPSPGDRAITKKTSNLGICAYKQIRAPRDTHLALNLLNFTSNYFKSLSTARHKKCDCE